MWGDIGKTTLRVFARVLREMRELEIFELENRLHRLAMIVVYQPRIQASLDEALLTWNEHGLRTTRHRSPNARYSLSRQAAILGGYWEGDAGDAQEQVAADPDYGVDDGEDMEVEEPYEDEEINGQEEDDEEPDNGDGEEDEAAYNLLEEQLAWARTVIGGLDVMRQDNRVGMNVYVEVLTMLEARGAEGQSRRCKISIFRMC